MNEIMSLEQLEKLLKNPSYKLSDAQMARLEELRNERYNTRKHAYTVPKHDTGVNKHETGEPHGAS